jgi:hypothetical protein
MYERSKEIKISCARLKLLFLYSSFHEQKKSKDEKPERKPFNRETDMQVNKFDDARKKSAIKNSQLLDDRFSRGNRKFL